MFFENIICFLLLCSKPVEIVIQPLPEPTIKELIDEAFPNDPIMHKVAYCESSYRQYDKEGNVIRNKVSEDWGLFQINSIWHKEALYQNIDITSIKGNIEMAKYIMNKQGLNAWYSSKSCWLPRNNT